MTETRHELSIDLSIGGMTCQGCVATITRGLTGLDGVAEATVNLATKRATVRSDGTIDPGALEESMRQTITGLGYQVLTAESPRPDAADSISARADEHAAHVASETARARDLGRRFVFAALLTAPLVLLSMIEAWHFPGWGWVAAALATPVYLWSGQPFHRSALMAARHGATTMDTLVSMGTTAAWTWSMTVLVGGTVGVGTLDEAHVYFETGAVIVTLILLGKGIEVRSTSRASDAIRALSRVQASSVRLEDGSEIPLDGLRVRMRFEVRPGEAVATDGRVVDGEASIDASLVTGEAVPVRVSPGSEVIGGTIATDGALVVEATKVGKETLIAEIARMVDEAQTRKARIQRLADRISSVFVPVVLVLALGTVAGWLVVTGEVDRAFTAAVAVLIISCPCALGLATPLAIMVGTGQGARLGMLIRGGPVLESARKVQTVVLDKTGTVTEGRMTVVGVEAPGLDSATRDALMEAAASVDKWSEHPIGKAIADQGTEHRRVKGFRATPGHGVSAIVEMDGGRVEVHVGSRKMFDRIPEALVEIAEQAESRGATAVFVGRVPVSGDKAIPVRASVTAEAVVEVRDTVKSGSAEAVQAFRDLGLGVLLVTGDNERSAKAIAAEVGIDDVRAEVLPGDKVEVVAALQATGRRVAMVGDGINDAPALAQADLGIALGTGTDVAREASDLTIVSGDLRAAVDAIRLARRTYSTIVGNLVWAFAYNVAAIPLAAMGLLNPMIASAAMGGSSLFVVGNSLRLKGFAPRR